MSQGNWDQSAQLRAAIRDGRMMSAGRAQRRAGLELAADHMSRRARAAADGDKLAAMNGQPSRADLKPAQGSHR